MRDGVRDGVRYRVRDGVRDRVRKVARESHGTSTKCIVPFYSLFSLEIYNRI